MFDLIEAYKCMTGLGSLDGSLFQRNEGNHNTRSKENGELVKPKFNHNFRKSFFTVRCIDKWNLVPQNIRQGSSLKVFKKNVKMYLASQDEEDF